MAFIVSIIQNNMYVFGGSTGGALEDFHQLDLETSTWSLVPTISPRSPGVSYLLDRNGEDANDTDLYTRNWNFYPNRDDFGVSNYRTFRRNLEGNNFDLNDDFENGKTLFYDHDFKHTVTIEPKKNRTLIFDIDLFHKGEQVSKGEKYWIGTELVCNKV